METIRLTELSKRIYWFINIRWIAIAGVIIAINFAKLFQNLPLNYTFLYLVSGVLTIFNILYLAFYNYILNRKSTLFNKKIIDRFANFQVFIDLFILTLLLHGSGGLHSPFTYYYVFHMVIASMLLSASGAFIQGAVAMVSLTIIIILSSYNVIPYYPLPGFSPQPGDETYAVFVLSRLGGLTSTIFILIFMSSSISKHLNKKEEQLEKANKELTLANDEKSKYILQVTHELRAPLAAIQSYLKVALEGFVGPIEGKLKEMLQNISGRTANMLVMVNELLDLADLKRPKKSIMEKGLCNIKNHVNKIIHLFEHTLMDKNISIETKIDNKMEIFANDELLSIMLTNIINNAIKYSKPDGKIDIEISKPRGKFLITIADDGIGIPAEDQKNIFQEFFRANNAIEREKDGTGLGLAIVADIIKKHDGKIRVESSPGIGSTFFIEMPE